MKPTIEEFDQAYRVIMAFIDDEPGSRKLFHTLLSFYLRVKYPDEDD